MNSLILTWISNNEKYGPEKNLIEYLNKYIKEAIDITNKSYNLEKNDFYLNLRNILRGSHPFSMLNFNADVLTQKSIGNKYSIFSLEAFVRKYVEESVTEEEELVTDIKSIEDMKDYGEFVNKYNTLYESKELKVNLDVNKMIQDGFLKIYRKVYVYHDITNEIDFSKLDKRTSSVLLLFRYYNFVKTGYELYKMLYIYDKKENLDWNQNLKDKINEFNAEVGKIYKDYSGADIFDLTNLDKIIEEFISRYLFDYRKLNKINYEFKGSEGLSVYLVY